MKKKKRLKKRKDSISFLFAKYQTVMFLILLLLFFANSISLYLAERQNMVAERSYQLKAAAEKVNTRIENFETSMMEILAAIRNDYKGLWLDGTPLSLLQGCAKLGMAESAPYLHQR